MFGLLLLRHSQSGKNILETEKMHEAYNENQGNSADHVNSGFIAQV